MHAILIVPTAIKEDERELTCQDVRGELVGELGTHAQILVEHTSFGDTSCVRLLASCKVDPDTTQALQKASKKVAERFQKRFRVSCHIMEVGEIYSYPKAA